MVGEPALRVVVGADAFRTVTTADQCAAGIGQLFLCSGSLLVFEARRQPTHGPGPVLVLRTFFLALDDNAGGQVGNTHRRIGLVDVLPTSARSTVGVYTQVGRVDVNGCLLVRLRQHRYRTGRRMHPALGFGFRHTLHAVGT